MHAEAGDRVHHQPPAVRLNGLRDPLHVVEHAGGGLAVGREHHCERRIRGQRAMVADASLEDVFLKLVQADVRREDLSWIG